MQKAKEQGWRDLIEDCMTEPTAGKMWEVINSLKGSPNTNSPNEAMHHNGRTITSNRKKADLFVSHYARVSSHTFSKEERDENREVKKLLRSASSAPDESCNNFTMGELKKAIAKMKTKGAEGPDGIPPTFLKALGPFALTELLGIFNASFDTSVVPQSWRDAIMLPLLKADKPASEIASFRPISLTSCMCKLMERMLNERLYHIAESKGIFNNQQAGFRKLRGCEDQIARVIQAIQDGFEAKKKSVLVLLDF
jgi:potassium voltage-gated channel Eag-related subfamily H protein 8